MVQVVVEGSLDGAIATRLLDVAGLAVSQILTKNGRRNLEAKVRDYHAASKHSAWFVLADLDRDACAGEVVRGLNVPNVDKYFVFRYAVTEAESWLLADRRNFAKALMISVDAVPQYPDQILDPKSTLVNLARRSRSRLVREDIVPDSRSLRTEGPGYNLRLGKFVREAWDPDAGSQGSPSLARCLVALRALNDRISDLSR